MTAFTISEDKKSLTLERTFHTTQDKLWEAYTTPEMLDQWFAPKGWECVTKEHAFEDNGHWVYTLKCVDMEQTDFYEQEMPGMLIFDSINPEDSFGYTDAFLNEQGEVDESMPSSHTVLTLETLDNGDVRLSFTTTYASPEALQEVIEMGVQQGLEESHEKLASLVEKA